MISKQETFNPSPYLAKSMTSLISPSFLDVLKTKYCLANKWNAIPSIRMFKYLLLKFICDLYDVVECSKYDVTFKYFLEMVPEEDVMDPSSLTKFRILRLKDVGLLDMLTEKTVEIMLVKKASKAPPLSSMRSIQRNVRNAIYKVDVSIKNKLPKKITFKQVTDVLAYCEKVLETIETEP